MGQFFLGPVFLPFSRSFLRSVLCLRATKWLQQPQIFHCIQGRKKMKVEAIVIAVFLCVLSEKQNLLWTPISTYALWDRVSQTVKNPPTVWETWVRSLDWEDPLEESMATHCSILAWRIPRTEEPGGPQSIGLQRIGHNWSALAHSTLHRWYLKTLEFNFIE